MLKFNKLFSCKIISATMIIISLSTAIAYPSLIPKENSLRVPVGKKDVVLQRMQEAIQEINRLPPEAVDELSRSQAFARGLLQANQAIARLNDPVDLGEGFRLVKEEDGYFILINARGVELGFVDLKAHPQGVMVDFVTDESLHRTGIGVRILKVLRQYFGETIAFVGKSGGYINHNRVRLETEGLGPIAIDISRGSSLAAYKIWSFTGRSNFALIRGIICSATVRTCQ